ncbi:MULTISPECIES: hypothetical protein [unclassified Novosphingobium]|uniref:hypothetical protein n=1 Tax=unclassified Novosphingobium TaxID=2644732 RepID=UPI000D2FAA77|nr:MULTISPECIES: hypothetical protein [unclassified Novosphingobium]PTR05378.1 hypothetical protein C8K11_1345 [Novosphingobium sp. GV055]PUA93942.1 hypothetical protein C8K12_1345 [Novosphingobium sp. GV061]PUB11359.1 hypothetical protein C8K14_1345 [Novosphingobium sp. GV079]PUB37049.1 hypothetical protein C8K10_1345 [Novosphingobium sp. GV027]
MSDRPIIFSAPMVRALLAGTKTQTRRLCAPANDAGLSFVVAIDDDPAKAGWFGDEEGEVQFFSRYAPGDRLYVREAWRVSKMHDATAPRDLEPRSMTVAFEAGGSIANQDRIGDWRPSDTSYTQADWMGRRRQGMHMPRWASRLTLTVTDVRVERLRSISDRDAVAEGLERACAFGLLPAYRGSPDLEPRIYPDSAYGDLWDSLHTAPGTRWDDDPWVVAVSFDVAHGNIDGGQHGLR